jgi:branched-chain amino acid transport system substrate-binding protein
MKRLFNQKTNFFLAGALICMLLLSACVTSNSSTSSNSGSTIPAGPIKIGVSVSLTGDNSADGQAIKQGYEYWASYVNANGGLLGHQVQIVSYDDATKPDQTRINYEKLVTVDKVNFIVGPFDDAFTVAGAEVAARHGLAFIDATGTSHDDFTHGLPLFCVSLSTSKYMSSLIDFLLSLPASMRPKTVAYAGNDTPFILEQVVNAKPALEAGGIKTALYDIYPAEQTDFNPVAAKVVNSNADVVILGSSTLQEAVAYLKYFQTQKYNPKLIIATSGPDQGGAFTAALGGSKPAEGILVANGGWWPTVKTYQNAIFVAGFTAKYKVQPGDIASDSVQAFSVGQVLQQAVTQAQSLDNAKVMAVLRTGTYQTLQGSVKFASDGENTLAIPYLFQWQQDNLIPVYPASGATANLEYPKPVWP